MLLLMWNASLPPLCQPPWHLKLCSKYKSSSKKDDNNTSWINKCTIPPARSILCHFKMIPYSKLKDIDGISRTDKSSNRNNLDRLKSHLATHTHHRFSLIFTTITRWGSWSSYLRKQQCKRIGRLAQGYTVRVMGSRAGSWNVAWLQNPCPHTRHRL